MEKNHRQDDYVLNGKVSRKNFYVVGVGASAGGLEAIHELFDHFPNDSNLSFIIIQHLSSDYKSLLAELIAKHTKMKVAEAGNNITALPNHIYVIPNRKIMTISNGKLRLKDKDDTFVPNNAIDIFFNSLAMEMGDRAIGIVLSGTGSDGTKGLSAIKQAGGFTLVQEPASAKFDGMPTSAISSGLADLTAAPHEMPEMILNYIKKGTKNGKRVLLEPDDQDAVREILELVKKHTKQDFSNYKKPTIIRRIQKRMLDNNIKVFSEYQRLLATSEMEIEKLSKDFLIGVTKFFRDKEAFDVIQEKVIPALCSSKSENDALKIWIAACSMGEEAYSVAMLVEEYLQKENLSLNVKIFASDIDKEAIEVASKGKYPLSIKDEVSPERLEKFFNKEKDHYIVNPTIRKMVIFAQHDVCKDPPFSKMDMVSCRNLLIYLDPYLQNKVLSSFNFSLNLGGYLFLGTSENPGDFKDDLLEVDKKNKIYQKIKVSSRSSLYLTDSLNFKPPTISPYSSYKSVSSKPKIAEVFAEILSEEFGTAGIIIDSNYQVIQGIGDYGRFLHLPEKDLSFNLLKMVPEDLSYVLGSSIRKALSQKKKFSSKLRIKKDGATMNISVTVSLIEDSIASAQKYFFILLRENRDLEPADHAPRIEFIDKTTESSRRLSDLEDELKETKQNLQSVVEELETSNEELQSSNEELISANEELQSTNEELQSLNEELHTVNTEHQLKIKELQELNDDLNNFFTSSEIGQIFLDSNLIIRRFTPTIKDLINLIETDIGRPIDHLSNNLKDENLLRDINHVLETGGIIEKEFEIKNGKFYLTRILPYIRLDKRKDGVVITFVDITDLKNLNSLISGILNSSVSGIIALKPIYSKTKEIVDFEFIMANGSAERLLGKSHFLGKRLLETFPAYKSNGFFEKYVLLFENGGVLHEEYQYSNLKEVLWVESVGVKIETGIAVTITNIHDKKLAEEKSLIAYNELKKVEGNLIQLNNELEERVQRRTRELAVSEERFRLISQATNDVIWDWNLVTNERWWNDGYKKILGYEEETTSLKTESWSDKIHPADKERVLQSIYDAINYGSNLWSSEYKFQRADGSYIYILDRGEVLHDENGVPYRMLGSMVDLTESKKAAEAIYVKNRELVKINELLDTFVYSAAHDLKSPVANLKILVDLLKEKGESGRTDLLAAIDTSVKRLDNTINGLVEIVEARSVDTEKIKKINFAEIVERILDENKNQVQATKAEIQYDFSDVESVVYIEAYLSSIMNNLISNALKYGSKERSLVIKMFTFKDNGFVVFCIQDNGIGMDLQKYGKNLFKPFNRFAKHVEGTGIGLYLIKNMVENNEGKIEVESKVNEGTTFKVYLKEYLAE